MSAAYYPVWGKFWHFTDVGMWVDAIFQWDPYSQQEKIPQQGRPPCFEVGLSDIIFF
jgi:hypothetical protein